MNAGRGPLLAAFVGFERREGVGTKRKISLRDKRSMWMAAMKHIKSAGPALPTWAILAAMAFGAGACTDAPPPVQSDGGTVGPGLPASDAGSASAGDAGPSVDAGTFVDAGMPTEPVREPSPSDPRNAELDSDCDGISDAEEYTATYAAGARTNPAAWDSDGDGIADGVEIGRVAAIDAECTSTWRDADPSTKTNPTVSDTDGDCIKDGDEDRNRNGRVDPGESDPNGVDSDGDGILEGDEDVNCNGRVDPGETDPGRLDSDADGLNDGVEVNETQTDPADPDTDDDGILDGLDDNPLAPDPDADGDGLSDSRELEIGTNAMSADSDGDGLCDGATDVAGVCVGGEDLDGDGSVDPGESDPNKPDTDCDGLPDGVERELGTQPRIADSDGDLIPDGVEVGRSVPVPGGCSETPLDMDPSTTTDPLAVDSDGDGINDGIEDRNRDGKLAPPVPGGTQETDATSADTDSDGICDGPNNVNGVCTAGEDRNRNGRVDAGETDPRTPDVDSDGDGLSNPTETSLGTDPNRADTDNDGLEDAEEVLTYETDPVSADSDCDGLTDAEELALGTDPLLVDSDGDGLTDGQERGRQQAVAATNCSDIFVPDADPMTTTDPLSADSDNDGVVDGAEDGNQNGRVDAGELNPADATDANSGATQQACANPIEPILHMQALSDILLATSPDFLPSNAQEIVVDGIVQGLTVVDPAHGLVGFALRKSPEGASPSAELTAIENRIGNLTLPLVQSFTSWDGFAATRGSYNLGNNGGLASVLGRVVRRTLNRGANDASVVVSANSAPNEAGPFKLAVEVVRRSGATSLVVGAFTQLTAYENPASGRDFRLEDVAGGTALGQYGDAIGQQCQRFQSQARQPVDFIWVLDNSGSMGDELAAVQAAANQMVNQLNNSTIDWRLAVVTTEFQLRSSGPDFGAGTIGTCDFNGNIAVAPSGNRVCMCRFVSENNASDFQTCIGRIQQLGGSGAEGGYGPLKSALTDVFTQPFVPNVPPSAAAVASRIRDNARVVTFFVTDAGEQTPLSRDRRAPYAPSNDLNASVSHWVDFFDGGSGTNSWNPRRNDEPPMIVGGILCPFAANCEGEDDSTGPEPQNFDNNGVGGESLARDRYYRVIDALGGVTGTIANPNGGTLADLGDIASTIEGLLNVVIGTVTPYELDRDPIASTLKVALAGPVVSPAACGSLSNVPRSRLNGFGYDATTNRIGFFGACRPTQADTEIALSYRTWIDRTFDPDGADQPCDGLCEPPFVCINDQCLCPSDCGTGMGLPASQTCNAATCTPECLADCGGECSAGQVCDTDACACTCPADCNGPQPTANHVCDLSTCQWSCPENGCSEAERPAGSGWFCGPTCEWECPSDCGVELAAAEVCDPNTCTAKCASDCNGACNGYETCDTETCACACVESATCAPGFRFDVDACACVCDVDALGCSATHWADTDSCSCRCGTDAQGQNNCNDACEVGQFCDPGQCRCLSLGG